MVMDVAVALIILQLIYLEGILSIDNAAVLGAMVAHLPRHERIPWPPPLRMFQRPVHKLLGGQRLAAVLFTRLIERYPVLEAAAYILVLNIGIELLLEDLFRIHISDLQKFGVSLSTLVVTLLYGGIPALQRIGRRVRWVKRVLGYLDLLFIYALRPVAWVIHGLLVLLRAILAVLTARRHAADTD